MTSSFVQIDDDDFDWEAAVFEIDSACQSATPDASNVRNVIPIPPLPSTDGFCPSEARQSTLDRFVINLTKRRGVINHQSEAFPQESIAGALGKENDPSHAGDEAQAVSIDFEAAKTWIYPLNVPLRGYQLAITKSSLFSNTLVALPTGLGKTLIAAVVMYNYFRWFPQGKIVFAAPSRPLVMQQIEACHNIVGIPQEWTIDMTGRMNPRKRLKFWKAKRVFFVTPQVLEKDIQSGICSVKQLICLVIDEAHRALGNYSYTVAVRELMAMSLQLRILGLTATPGSKHQTIQNVIDNLCISTLEYRHESDLDVSPYVHNRKIELVEVPMGDDAVGLDNLLMQTIQPIVASLGAIGVIPHRALSLQELLNLKDKFCKSPPDSPPISGEVVKRIIDLISFCHIRRLLSVHGIRPAYEMLSKKLNQGWLAKRGLTTEALWEAKRLMQKSLSGGVPTPKLAKMLEILVDHFRTKGTNDSRVIIFSSFRESVSDIMDSLSTIGDMVKATKFIGQSSGKSFKGQSQKVQQSILQQFRAGRFNVIVATSIGEEGLDIMEVDLVICFDANVSPLRMIQRMGRTGRKNDGRVVVLACEGAERKAYVKKQAKHNSVRKLMHNGGIQSFNFHSSPRMVPHSCKPEVQFFEFSIEKFVPYGKKPKNEAMDRSTFSRNLTNDEQKCIDKYFHSSSDVSWKPSLIAFPSFQALPSQVSTVRHSFRTTMFVDAMQRLQALSPSMAEIGSRPYNECGASRGKIGQDSAFRLTIDGTSDSTFQVPADQILESNPSLPRQHNDVPKPKTHCFLFNEGSTTVNSFGSVSISYVPVLQHKGNKGHKVVSRAYSVLATAGPIHVYTSGFSPKASSKVTMKMKDTISEASSALKPADNIGSPQSNLCAYAVKNVIENGKHVSQTNSDNLNQKVLEYSSEEINDDMQCFPASPVDKSSNTEIEIERNTKVTHLIEHGTVPEISMLSTDNYSPLDGKKAFSSFSWFGETDGRALSQMHVNKLSVDELRSQPDVIGVNPCQSNIRTQTGSPLNVLYEKGMETLKSTIDEGKKMACIEHETELTPVAKASSQTSGVDWKPNSCEASNSVFQVTKYKRLRKYVNEVGKLPAGFAEGRIELIETTFASTMSIQDTKKKWKDGRNEKAMQDVDAFFEEEAEVSEDAPISEDEVMDEKNDQYDDSFIDDRPNPTEVSTTAESTGINMMTFYRRSLLSQSPIVVPGKLTATSHESFSSEAAESCSPEKERNNTVTPQDVSRSISRLDDSNSLIGCKPSGNAALTVEPDNYSERCSARIESRKRKLIFQLPPADTIKENSQPRCETQKAHVEHVSPNHPVCLRKLDTNLSCDDDFYQSLDLDEVEAQAAKLLRYRSESLIRKSQATGHDHKTQRDGASPSFDLGI